MEYTRRMVGRPGTPQTSAYMEQPSESVMPPELAARLLSQPAGEDRIGKREIGKAIEILQKYKDGKSSLESRIVEDELWWELRHWEALKGKKDDASPKPTSAWLFNAISNKHADAMDNFPEPAVLPREQSDQQSATILSEILPVVLEYNNFEEVYSDQWWEKLKHGTSAYGIFWDKSKENGLGDISIKGIDLLKLFWEPGITDLQQSRNLFVVELVDEDILDRQYPDHAGKMGGSVINVKEYIYDDTVDTSGKSLVVDWYYKVQAPSGKTILHYVKFVGDELLYASENDPQYRDRGYYDHGMYPVVLDVLFPEKGTPIGFGYVALCKDPQMYIDALSGNILENAMMATKKRYFVSANTNINEDEFLDWNRPLVHAEGELDDVRLKEIPVSGISSTYLDIMQLKIEEMKDTASNRDVSSGGVTSGVTAAAAISALQEAGNKTSRDMIAASYRAYVTMSSMCIELMRQFYDVSRSFRIVGAGAGDYDFVEFSNAQIKDQPLPPAYPGQEAEAGYIQLYRKPIFDIKIKAQKKSPFSRMEQNERAKELYGLGFFNPDRAQEALGALQMMDFEGIDDVRKHVMEGQTLLNICMQLKQQVVALQAAMGIVPQAQGTGTQRKTAQTTGSNGNSIGNAVTQAQQGATTNYAQSLAKRSSPDMDSRSSAATPRT